MRNFAEFARKYLRRNLFFDKVKLCRYAPSLKTRLFCCKFCKIRKNTFFAKHHQATASDYSSINCLLFSQKNSIADV